jgi:hypothetical protein
MIVALPVMLLIDLASEARAEESEAKETKFSIKPMVSVDARYEDNFYLTEDNEIGMYTYIVAPGIVLGMETPKLKVDFSYTAEITSYDQQGESSAPAGQKAGSDLDYLGHLAALTSRYQLTEKLTIGLDDSFYVTRYPTYYERLSDSTDRRKYWINRLTPMIYYDIDTRFSTGFRYQRENLEYTDSSYEDSTADRFYFDFIYNPSRTITLDLNYNYWTRDYDLSPPSDYDTHQITLAAQKRYKYFSFDGEAGYQGRSFDDNFLDDANNFRYKFSITAQNPPPPELRRVMGEVPERARSHIYLAVENTLNDVGPTYTGQRFTLSAGHVFLQKLLTMVRAYYQLSDYDTERGLTPDGSLAVRDDDTYNFYGRVGYLITEKIMLSFTAGRENRDSNLAGFDYVDNYAYIRFDFNYDINSRGGYSEEAVYY